MTQKEAIMQFIKDEGSIDRLRAINELGVFELSARICELKRKGFSFEVTKQQKANRYGHIFTYCVYRVKP